MNKGRVDFDGALSFERLRQAGVQVRAFDDDYDGPSDIVERAKGERSAYDVDEGDVMLFRSKAKHGMQIVTKGTPHCVGMIVWI